MTGPSEHPDDPRPPTLEDIADQFWAFQGQGDAKAAVLARELVALREQMPRWVCEVCGSPEWKDGLCMCAVTSLRERVRALEASASSGGREPADEQEAYWYRRWFHRDADASRHQAERDEARRERNVLIGQRDLALNERDDSYAERDSLQQQLAAMRPSFMALETVRDADVLRGYSELAQEVSDALIAPHGADCRKRMYDRRSSPCTCGLTESMPANTEEAS